VIIINKYDIGNISRTEGVMIARNQYIVGNNMKIQKIIMKLKRDLRSDSSKAINGIWSADHF
jgi:hypothetical protein